MRADPVRWEAHKARHREYCKRRYAERQDVRDKSREYAKAYRAIPANRAKVNARIRKWEKATRNPHRWLSNSLNGARSRAKAGGISFSVTANDIYLPRYCPVFGVPLNYLGGAINDPAAASLDRLRPELGYVAGNVRVICRQANAMKNDGTLAQHRQLVAWMERELEPERQHTEGII